MKALGAASPQLGPLCIGAALEFGVARRWVRPGLTSSVAKVLAMPIATVLVSMLTGLRGPALTTALLIQVLLPASSAYILARQLGGDAPLMAGVTAPQTVLALAANPLMLIGLAAVVQF